MILYFLFAAFYLYRYIRNRVGYLCSNDFVYDTQLNGSLLICKGVNPPSTSSSVGSVHHCTHRGHHVECGLYCRQQDRTAAVLPFPSHGYYRSNFAGEFVAVNLMCPLIMQSHDRSLVPFVSWDRFSVRLRVARCWSLWLSATESCAPS
jgi:hypothetical protein